MTIQLPVTAATVQAGVGQGLAQGTLVLTLDGLLPVEYLTPGDRMITRKGAMRLAEVEMTLVQNARVICISADTLGSDCPVDDIRVSPDQPVFVRDWRARALTGQDRAMIAAARLVDGEFIRAEVMPELRLYTLRFAEEAVIYAAGLELSCTAATVTA